MVLCHFGLLDMHDASISGHWFQFKTYCIPCSTATPVYHVFPHCFSMMIH